MTQQLGQVAADAMSTLETACNDQEWDHKTAYALHDSKLARMEADEMCTMDTRAEEEQRSVTHKFMCRVALLDVTAQFMKSKAIISSRVQGSD